MLEHQWDLSATPSHVRLFVVAVGVGVGAEARDPHHVLDRIFLGSEELGELNVLRDQAVQAAQVRRFLD